MLFIFNELKYIELTLKLKYYNSQVDAVSVY